MTDCCDFASLSLSLSLSCLHKNKMRGLLHECLRVNVCLGRVFGLQCKCIDPKNQGNKVVCAFPKYKGDGNCDDANNKKDCGYDGGDCCAKTVKGGQVKTKYCKAVGL